MKAKKSPDLSIEAFFEIWCPEEERNPHPKPLIFKSTKVK
jgi:hypothetical protein